MFYLLIKLLMSLTIEAVTWVVLRTSPLKMTIVIWIRVSLITSCWSYPKMGPLLLLIDAWLELCKMKRRLQQALRIRLWENWPQISSSLVVMEGLHCWTFLWRKPTASKIHKLSMYLDQSRLRISHQQARHLKMSRLSPQMQLLCFLHRWVVLWTKTSVVRWRLSQTVDTKGIREATFYGRARQTYVTQRCQTGRVKEGNCSKLLLAILKTKSIKDIWEGRCLTQALKRSSLIGNSSGFHSPVWSLMVMNKQGICFFRNGTVSSEALKKMEAQTKYPTEQLLLRK